MKYLKIWAAAALLCAVSAVSFTLGRDYECKYFGQKIYNDASRMSDLIRCYEDHLKDTSDVKLQDWGCFEELEGIYLYDDALGEPVHLEDYIYCY